MSLYRTLAFSLLIGLSVAAAPVTQPASLAPDSFDFVTLLGNPPANDSQQHKDEIAQLLQLQASRTPADVARCNEEVDGNAFELASVLGSSFNENDLPITAKLLDDAAKMAKPVFAAAKKVWNRHRPPVDNPEIHPCVPNEKTASYPSGHATRGMLWATIVAEIYPEKRDALLARGKQFGDDRFLSGIHYPSDVAAGQKLGAEIARRLLADPDFQARLKAAKAECLAVPATKP
jgi:hypothetical protein